MFKTQPCDVLILAFYMLSSTMALLIKKDYFGSLPMFTDMVTAIHEVVDIATFSGSQEYLFLVDGDIISISNFTMHDTSSLSKRWNTSEFPSGASWIRSRIVDQGTTWGPWRSTSCPQENKAKTPKLFVMNITWEYSATWDAGFKFNLAKYKALKDGYEICEDIRDSGEGHYMVPARSFGQLFRRQFVLWQDQQQQRCAIDSSMPDGIKCGDWGEIIRGSLPIKNAQGFGWRVGARNMAFHKCRGSYQRKRAFAQFNFR